MASKDSHLDGLFDNIDPAELHQPCQEKHLSKISDLIPQWEELTPFLDLSEVEVEDIKETKSTPKLRRREMLKKWKQKKGKKATYQKLAEILAFHGRRNVAEIFCEMIKPSLSDDEEEDMETVQKQERAVEVNIAKYGDHLRGVYQRELSYSLDMDSLPSPTHPHVFNLSLISQQNIQYGTTIKNLTELIMNGEVEEILDDKSEVQLENIFRIERPVGTCTRKFILFEGAPGAGKSTLACFICQKWGSGELFQEFNLVIFVQLNDPRTQSAQSLADVFHSGSYFDTEQIVSHLQSEQGRGILFILDGWDEYSPQLKEGSLFEKLICTPSQLSMHLSSVIVTSRPVSSGQLQRYCSARIQIIGFKPEELKCYFQAALNNDDNAVAKLEQCLKEKPLLKKSCCLPLNAAIVAHTFLATDGSLPATLYDLFKLLVSTVIERHLEKVGCTSNSTTDTLDTLPSPYKEQLESLCKLAYDGVLKNNMTFSDDDLKSHGISSPDCMLSLLHGIPSFTGRRQSVYYHFLHLMMQEFLATRYILQLPFREQFKAFQPLFCQPRFVACFQFYASQLDNNEHASDLCFFFARVFKEIQSQVNKKSQKCPKKWQGGKEQSENGIVFEDLSTEEHGSLSPPLSSLDPVHIVAYIPLPFFDVGYVLVSLSITRDRKMRIECCACITDDVMLYGSVYITLSGLPIVPTSRNTRASNELPQLYFYHSVDLISELFPGSKRDEVVKSLPPSFLTVKDRSVLMTFISPLSFRMIGDMFNSGADIDYSDILLIGNATGEVKMEGVNQQYFENFSEHCQIQ